MENVENGLISLTNTTPSKDEQFLAAAEWQ